MAGQFRVDVLRLDARKVVLSLEGEFDIASSETFRLAFRDVEDDLREREESDTTVIADLRKITFIDSSGLRNLMGADARVRAEGARFAIVQGPPMVRRLLKLTDMERRLEVVDPPEGGWSNGNGTGSHRSP